MKNNHIKSYLFAIIITLGYCFFFFLILKNKHPIYHKKFSLKEAISLKKESALKEKIREDKDWMAIINDRSRKNEIEVNDLLQRDCQFIFEHGLNHYWVDYYITRIKSDSTWYQDIEKSALERNIPVDSSLIRAARYMASQKTSN